MATGAAYRRASSDAALLTVGGWAALAVPVLVGSALAYARLSPVGFEAFGSLGLPRSTTSYSLRAPVRDAARRRGGDA